MAYEEGEKMNKTGKITFEVDYETNKVKWEVDVEDAKVKHLAMLMASMDVIKDKVKDIYRHGRD